MLHYKDFSTVIADQVPRLGVGDTELKRLYLLWKSPDLVITT